MGNLLGKISGYVDYPYTVHVLTFECLGILRIKINRCFQKAIRKFWVLCRTSKPFGDTLVLGRNNLVGALNGDLLNVLFFY